MSKWILENWEALLASGPIAGLIAYITTKRKRKVESLDGIAAAYDRFVEDHNDRYDAIKSELEMLKKEVSELNIIIKQNTNEIEDLKKENVLLHQEVDDWKKKYNILKSAFDLYKKRISNEKPT
jgi:archaellum component FlaC